MATKIKEQHVAVFGESGSGKTVLLSSFFGATQQAAFSSHKHYRVVADDTGQGRRLRQNYLRMANEAQTPPANRFSSTQYSFTVKPTDGEGDKPLKGKRFNALRLVWHDYPGEWLEEEPSSAEESARRVETFRRLLRSDVAFVLVDGQKLRDYAGEEGKYLKSMLWGLRDLLDKLKDEILANDGPLVEFPRIWVLALSKADLHPNIDVRQFQDLVIEKAAEDVAALHETLKAIVQTPAAMSFGDDYLLLSSAKFELEKIEVSERVGVDLILPIACMLPVERFAQWADKYDLPTKLLGTFLEHADAFAAALIAGAAFAAKFLGRVPHVGHLLQLLVVPAVTEAVRQGAAKLEEVHEQAIKDKDYFSALLVKFRLDLQRGVKEALLIKSPW